MGEAPGLPSLPKWAVMPPEAEKGLFPQIFGSARTKCLTCGSADEMGDPRIIKVPILRAIDAVEEVYEITCKCGDQFVLDCWFGVHGISRALGRLYVSDGFALPQDDRWGPHNELIDNIMKGTISRAVGYTISGKQGSGKSMAAGMVVKGALRLGLKAQIIRGEALFDSVANSWRSDEWGEWVQKRVKGADLLVIDPVESTTSMPKHAGRVLSEMVAERIANEKVTIIVTDLDADAWKARWGWSLNRLGGYISLHDREPFGDTFHWIQRRWGVRGWTRPIWFEKFPFGAEKTQ